jgi:hypothetical protein
MTEDAIGKGKGKNPMEVILEKTGCLRDLDIDVSFQCGYE